MYSGPQDMGFKALGALNQADVVLDRSENRSQTKHLQRVKQTLSGSGI